MPARHEQIDERAGHEQAMSVLLEPAITRFGETKHSLDDPDRDARPPLSRGQAFGPHLRFGAVFRPLGLVDNTAMAIAPVDKVSRARCVLADHCPLAAVGLVAPHAGSLPCNRSGSTVLSAT